MYRVSAGITGAGTHLARLYGRGRRGVPETLDFVRPDGGPRSVRRVGFVARPVPARPP